MLVLLLGASACEYFRGYVREVPVAVPPTEACVRRSLDEVPGLTVYAEGRSDGGFWFNWRGHADALGGVSVDRERTGGTLQLNTGWMNGCRPAALAAGRVLMDALLDRLRVNCAGLPEPGAVELKRVQACE